MCKVTVSFNRPQAIRCLATHTELDQGFVLGDRFNRPQAIRCLATHAVADRDQHTGGVSIARRRFVVLRPIGRPRGDAGRYGFNRPQAIRCLATG